MLGRNGAGKSTLLEVLSGRRKPQRGTVAVHGQVQAGLAGRAALRRTVGYLPQEARLPGGWTVTEYLSYASWLRGMSRAGAGREARDICALLELDAPERRTLGSLSRGPVIAAVHRVDEFVATASQVLDLSATCGDPR